MNAARQYNIFFHLMIILSKSRVIPSKFIGVFNQKSSFSNSACGSFFTKSSDGDWGQNSGGIHQRPILRITWTEKGKKMLCCYFLLEKVLNRSSLIFVLLVNNFLIKRTKEE